MDLTDVDPLGCRTIKRDRRFGLKEQELARRPKTELFIQTHRGLVLGDHFEEKLFVTFCGESRHHPIKHRAAYTAAAIRGDDGRSGVVDRRLPFPRSETVQRNSNWLAAVEASDGAIEVDGIQCDVILELPVGELELDYVIGKAGDKRLMDRAEKVSAEETAFKTGGFVCRLHLLKFGTYKAVRRKQ